MRHRFFGEVRGVLLKYYGDSAVFLWIVWLVGEFYLTLKPIEPQIVVQL